MPSTTWLEVIRNSNRREQDLRRFSPFKEQSIISHQWCKPESDLVMCSKCRCRFAHDVCSGLIIWSEAHSVLTQQSQPNVFPDLWLSKVWEQLMNTSSLRSDIQPTQVCRKMMPKCLRPLTSTLRCWAVLMLPPATKSRCGGSCNPIRGDLDDPQWTAMVFLCPLKCGVGPLLKNTLEAQQRFSREDA